MREDGDLADAYHADDGQGDGIDEDHPLAGIFLEEEAYGIDQLDECQYGN